MLAWINSCSQIKKLRNLNYEKHSAFWLRCDRTDLFRYLQKWYTFTKKNKNQQLLIRVRIRVYICNHFLIFFNVCPFSIHPTYYVSCDWEFLDRALRPTAQKTHFNFPVCSKLVRNLTICCIPKNCLPPFSLYSKILIRA